MKIMETLRFNKVFKNLTSVPTLLAECLIFGQQGMVSEFFEKYLRHVPN